MTTTEDIRILTWNIRGFNSEQDKLREEITRQQPHIVILQETMTWINAGTDICWTGTRVLKKEAINKTKGKRGGLTIFISPNIEFTELYRTAIGPDFEKAQNVTQLTELEGPISIFNAEEAMPEGEIDIEQRLAAEQNDVSPTASEPASAPTIPHNQTNQVTTYRKKSPTEEHDNQTPQPKPEKQTEKRNQHDEKRKAWRKRQSYKKKNKILFKPSLLN